jgi:putative endonuclease
LRIQRISALAADFRWSTGENPRMAFMYILECSDKSLYVGTTINLEARLWQHNEGEGALYTQTRRPVRLLYYEAYDRVEDAFRREKQVQNWSRAKRLALVHDHPERLPALSKKRFQRRGDDLGLDRPPEEP